MSAPTVDFHLYHQYRAVHPDEHAQWLAWLAEVVGRDPEGMEITAVTPGEGFVDVERLEQPFRVVGDEVARYVERYSAPTPPPCWPG